MFAAFFKGESGFVRMICRIEGITLVLPIDLFVIVPLCPCCALLTLKRVFRC
jgi:hypothetical protein